MKRYHITEDKHVFMEKGRRYVRDEFKKSLSFMPGFHKLHKLVTQRYSIGLVTASPRHNLNWLQTLINLDELFEHIISGDETKKNKPHPEPYLSMMEKLNVKPENVVVIEDSLHGIQAALASGAAVIAKTGSVSESDLLIAHRIITHLDEVTHNMIEAFPNESITSDQVKKNLIGSWFAIIESDSIILNILITLILKLK